MKRSATNLITTAPTPKPDENKTSVNEIPTKKQKKIDSFFKNKKSMEMMVSRMVSRGGYSLKSFCVDPDMRFLFSNSGFQLPKSPNTIRSIVTTFENTVKAKSEKNTGLQSLVLMCICKTVYLRYSQVIIFLFKNVYQFS